jgi:hypothetical protein
MCTRNLSRHLLVPLVVATFVACQYVTPRSGLSGDIMRLPADTVRARFAAYASSLRFTADAPFANRGVLTATGDTAYAEPEIGADHLRMNELGEGRVIARFKSRSPYPGAGLGPSWWTYWWVDGLGPGGTYRSVLVAIHDNVVFRQPRGLQFRYHLEHPSRTALIWPDSSCRRCGGWCALSLLAADTLVKW